MNELDTAIPRWYLATITIIATVKPRHGEAPGTWIRKTRRWRLSLRVGIGWEFHLRASISTLRVCVRKMQNAPSLLAPLFVLISPYYAVYGQNTIKNTITKDRREIVDDQP